MADLVTHLCSAFLVKASTHRAYTPVFVAGVVLPDWFSRVPSMGLSWMQRAGYAVPDALVYCWTPLHLPVGILLWSLVLAALGDLLRPGVGRAWFLNLLGGAALHLAFDLIQSHFTGGYLLLFPWSGQPFEFAWIGSEATVWIAFPLTLFTVWVWRWRPRANTTAT